MNTQRFILAGLLTIIPLWVTWLVLRFLFNLLAQAGSPAIQWLAATDSWPGPIKAILESALFTNVFSIILVIAVLYAIGRLTTVVVGRRVLAFFEAILDKIPIVSGVYGAVKKLVTVLQEQPGGGLRRVVLINFPSPEMKTVGLVTRVLTDSSSGRELAAVYVPTTPNPASGYL